MVNINLEENNQRRVLLKEAKTMVNLRSHGSLPTLVGICVDESPFKLVMDFCSFEGSAESLYPCLKARFAISIEKMHAIYLSLAEALYTVHTSDYLYNDIKLDNVVLRGIKVAMIPVLIDFNKSCPINHGRKYNLTEPSKKEYRSVCRHIAPEVVDGTNCQSIYSATYLTLATVHRNSNEF